MGPVQLGARLLRITPSLGDEDWGAGLAKGRAEWQFAERKLTSRPRVNMGSAGSGHCLAASLCVSTNALLLLFVVGVVCHCDRYPTESV